MDIKTEARKILADGEQAVIRFVDYEEHSLLALVADHPRTMISIVGTLTILLMAACYLPGLFAGCL